MKRVLSVSPHLHSGSSTQAIMLDVIIALIPAGLAAVIFFGLNAVTVIVSCVVAAVLTEFVVQYLLRREISVFDHSAALTGLLLALTLPPSTPWWVAAIGAFLAIFFGKQVFGGIGYNIFNPALVGRAFLLASYPVMITTWTKPFDTITAATPLALIKEGATQLPTLWSMFWGYIPGSLGETSAFALLLGAGYLFYRKIIDPVIPFTYIATVALLTFFSGGEVSYYILAGGLILGAFFMATDYTTTPMTIKGKFIFGLGAGLLTFIIRMYGGYPEGVCYSILIMNMFVPLIDKLGR